MEPRTDLPGRVQHRTGRASVRQRIRGGDVPGSLRSARPEGRDARRARAPRAGTAFTLASNAASTSADNAVPGIRHGIASDCEADSASPACKDYESAAQSRQTYGAIAAGSFIGAGIAGVATVILVFFPDAPITPKTGANGGLSVSLW